MRKRFSFLNKEGRLSTPVIILITAILSLIAAGIGMLIGVFIQSEGGENNSLNSGRVSCIPDCSNIQCGIESLCGQLCGTCSGGNVCTNGICVSQNCIPESAEKTCENSVCGTKINNCGAEIICPPGCAKGKICVNGICGSINILNSGIVEETWPGSSGLYFGSKDLPTNISYYGDYIKFPNSSEKRCLLISVYRFPVEGYPKSHIGFNFETSVKTGDNYQIFSGANDCQAY